MALNGKRYVSFACQLALAHYPSLEHFVDMIVSEDYQEMNQRWRVPSLRRDTCILCTSEVALDTEQERPRL